MIQTLFKSINELQDYITVDISSDIRTMLPYIKQAEKYTTDIIGKTLRAKLIDVVHNNLEDENLSQLLEFVRLPLANFAYLKAIAKLNINVGDAGFTVTVSSSLEPASQWRVQDFKESVENAGNDALEELIEFLEENRDVFPDWAESKAYSFQKQFFVNNAYEYEDALKYEISRLEFLKIRRFIHDAEQNQIKPAICSALFAKLKTQIKENNLSKPNKYLISEFIAPAVCYFADFKMNGSEFSNERGIESVRLLRQYLNENADTYSEYKESACFEDTSTGTTEKNSEDSGFYIM